MIQTKCFRPTRALVIIIFHFDPLFLLRKVYFLMKESFP